MAANAQVPKATTGNPQGKPEEWTEEQLEDALEKLKILHVKVSCKMIWLDLSTTNTHPGHTGAGNVR